MTLPANDDGSSSAALIIQNSPSLHKAKVPATFTSNVKTENKVFLSLDVVPLRIKQKLPDLPDLDSLINFFVSFTVKGMDQALILKKDDTKFEINEIEELVYFVL